MSEPQIGDLIFVKGSDWLGNLIAWAENGKYSHVALYTGNGQVLEADMARLIGYRPLSDYPTGSYDIGNIEATDAQRAQVLAFAQSKIGSRYDRILIFLLFLKLVLHINRPYEERKVFICSTYGNDAWKSGGKILTRVDKPTPQDLADSPEVTIETPIT